GALVGRRGRRVRRLERLRPALRDRRDPRRRVARARPRARLLVVRRDEQSVAADELPLVRGEPPLGARGELLGVRSRARDAGDRQRRPLPEVVVIDLRDGRPEPVPQVVLRRADEVPFALQRRGLGKVELGGEDRDVARGHAYEASPAPAGSSSDVRSTSRVSNTSKTSPSRRSLNPSRRMPHSKPSVTSRTSSLNRRSCATCVSWMRVPSRKMRTFAFRRTTPLVTMQPAIVPRRETLKSA